MGYVYIVLALVCFVTLAFSYRWADRSGADRVMMSPVIGCVGIFWALVFTGVHGIDLSQADASQVLIGSIVGVNFAVLVPVFLAALARGDLSISWMVLTLSFALTATALFIYPGESPSPTGTVGLVVAVVAIALLGLDMRARHRANHPSRPKHRWGLFMALAFVMNSATQYGFKLAQSTQPENNIAHNVAYLLSFYAAVLVTGTVLASALPRKGSFRQACTTGAAVGTCLVFGGFCVLQALSFEHVDGHVLFPVTAGGGSVFVAALSAIFLKERPGRFGWAGIVVGAAALTFLALAA